jgi:hypothetical protein
MGLSHFESPVTEVTGGKCIKALLLGAAALTLLGGPAAAQQDVKNDGREVHHSVAARRSCADAAGRSRSSTASRRA